VTRKTIFVTLLVISGAFEASGAAAQTTPHYSRKQLKLLMDNAASADDYQKLAHYFHYQQMLFQTKAQLLLDESARNSSRYPMATKTVTRAEVTKRAYDECTTKANENGALAEQYDRMLVELGVKPEIESTSVVSVGSLQKTNQTTPVSDFAAPKP
jgi:hypothetical protein